MNEYLISKLKEGRINKGLKQSDVTKCTGIKNTTLSNYENGVTEPDIDTFLLLCEFYELDYAGILAEAYGLSVQGESFKIKPSEIEIAKKYRYITEHFPNGAKTVDTVLDNEYSIAEQLEKQKARIEELESTPTSTIIKFQSHTDNNTRLIEYFHSASAGTGIFILGNETADQLAIPATPENRKVDYAIKVSGNSMEPDYHDGDIVLVSQKVELNIGDVGIFIINNNAYIKEYGETELISRNPISDNIKIAEYDNIVCMGKVIGKYR